ncbi:MAG TPA: tetratricopeptide repeat protein [Thermoanaerobaculia bacterium]
MRYTSALLLCLLLTPSVFASRAAEHAAAGQAAMERNQVDAAVAAYAKAVELEPKSARYHFLLGSAYGRQAQQSGTLKQAMLARKTKAHFEKAVEIDPGMIDARLALIDYYTIAPAVMGGSEEKALQQAAEIRKIDRLEGHRAFGRIYTRQKKTDLAKKEYLDAVRTHPESAKAHYFLGSFYMNEKDWTGALQSYDTALKLDPAYMVIYLRLGQLAAQSESHYQRGEEALRKYLSHKPGEAEPGHAGTWFWLGMLQEKQGRKTEARQSYTNALRLMPDSKNIKEALKRVS